MFIPFYLPCLSLSGRKRKRKENTKEEKGKHKRHQPINQKTPKTQMNKHKNHEGECKVCLSKDISGQKKQTGTGKILDFNCYTLLS